jgi:hypothetical protein
MLTWQGGLSFIDDIHFSHLVETIEGDAETAQMLGNAERNATLVAYRTACCLQQVFHALLRDVQ